MMQPSELIVDARSGKRVPPWWIVLPVAGLILLLSSLGGVLGAFFNLARHIGLENLPNTAPAEIQSQVYPQSAVEQALWLISSFAGVYLLLWLWLRLVEKRPFRTLGFRDSRTAARYGYGLLLGGLMFVLAAGIPWTMGFYRLDGAPLAVAGSLVVLFGWLVQGSAEELLFRGWLLPVLSARYGVPLGVSLSAVLFAAAHSLNPHLNVLAILNLVLFGLFTALYALRDGSIWRVAGVHAAWNWMQGNVFGISVSGMQPVGGSWLRLTESGPDWLTGGAFGAEGGLAVSLVLVAGIAFLLWQTKRGWSERSNHPREELN